jgi:FkbM family methyltransferase
MQSRSSVMSLFESLTRNYLPSLWQLQKYRNYLEGRAGEREIEIVHLFIDRQRAALDIGVHLGMYARHFSKFAKSVIGFEANPDLAAFSRRALHGIATIEWVALSSQSGQSVLRVPLLGKNDTEPMLGTISDANQLNGRKCREFLVPTRGLDEFDLPPIGFIKIDVEGHEEQVLKGGERLLERDRPAYMIEIEERHNPGSVARLIQYFEQKHYAGLFFDGNLLMGIHQMTRVNCMPSTNMYLNNFFFIPA